jgi:hypothetical protein
MGMYSQYINKTTSNFTSLFTSLQHKNDNALWKVYWVLKLIKGYINLNKEVLCAWKYPKANSTINNYCLEVYKDSNHYY